jgi:hydroxymethylpyrimidine/phosphomethylpyrimidine kinase
MDTQTSTHLFTGAPASSNGAASSMPVALTIAGSDPTSGAGIQADLKTFSAHNVYGLSVITAITAQNTTGVSAVYPIPLEAIIKQCETLIADIPFKILKTGMICEAAAIEFIADFITDHGLIAVIDTPFIASDGTILMEKDAIEFFRERLVPVAHLITPNIREAEILTRLKINAKADMERAAYALVAEGAKSILLKGGHLEGEYSPDVLVTTDEMIWLDAERIKGQNAHGTGCTLWNFIQQLAKPKIL